MAKNPNKVGVWQSLRNAWKVEDIRKKLIYTFFMLVLFRLVGVIPAPGVDYARVQAAMERVWDFEHARIIDETAAARNLLQMLNG